MIKTPNHSAVPLDANGEPIKLPENLESLPRADHFPSQRHRWNTNEEIAASLISFGKHAEWQSKEVKIRPKSGSMLLYSRKKVRYRRDGYCWKKRKDGKTTREDHMKLKVQGTECIYGCYVHSAILPTFHRRCYWLLQNPDIVLVHYLNVPYPDDNKLSIVTPNLSLWADKKEWTKEELVSQLKPMFFSEDEPDLNNELEISTAGTVEAIVTQLMEKQRVARQTALLKQLECGCNEGLCSEGKDCTNPIRRITKQPHSAPVSKNSRSVANINHRSVKQHNASLEQVESLNHSGNLVISQNVGTREVKNHQINQKSSSLVLSLSQFEGGGGLLILNSGSTVHNATFNQQKSFSINGVNQNCNSKTEIQNSHFILRQEIMDLASTLNLSDKNIKKEVKYQGVGENKQEFQNFGQASSLRATSIKNTKMIGLNGIECKENKDKDHNYYNSIVLIDTNSETVPTDKNNSFVGSSFFETLDLSQEDIQKTLTANMPLSTNSLVGNEHHMQDQRNDLKNKSNDKIIETPKDNPLDINPMEFINSCDAGGSPSPAVDDDVFVNLEAFDMLSEFPDLDVLDPSHNLLDSVNPSDSKLKIDVDDKVVSLEQSHSYSHPSVNNFGVTAKITDYSPEWAYPEGGSKVLVTGPWVSSKIYNVLFDHFSVPTTLVQNGVLRCYCPAHEVGLATLQVVCDGCVISNAVIFEYKLPPQGTTHINLGQNLKTDNSNENYLKFTLMHRLEALNNQVNVKQEPNSLDKVQDSIMFNEANFEDRLVNFCQNTLVQILNCGENLSSASESVNGMTLLHLAASLGYSKLSSCMLQWKKEMSSIVLETEVNALSRDYQGFTPLMWACANGHLKTAVMLYKWNPSALNVRNYENQTALELARKNKHNSLAYELEELENNGDKGMFVSTFGSDVSSSDCNSNDDVFLRPGSVSSTLLSNYPSNNNAYKLTKRPSVDSGIFIICNQDSNKPKPKIKDNSRFLKFDRSLSCPSTSPKDMDIDLSLKMDFCNELNNGDRSHSPLIDVEAISDDDGTNEDRSTNVGDQDARVLTLAEQIIAAMPDRIKHESEDILALGSSLESLENSSLSEIFSDTSLHQTSMSIDNTEFNFDEQNYRYYDVGTPCSSLSPASSSCLQSPSSFLMDSPTPPPTTADFCEFLQASGSFFEKDFSNLTLSDQEQRELYEAAKIIQKAYRSYKGRLQQEQNRERAAAVVIQNYYRRYKQYAYFKQMTHAAMVIQNGFRRYKQNQESYYYLRHDHGRDNLEGGSTNIRMKRASNQRRQNQAAKKIQQFMRQSKKNVWENGFGSMTSERTGRKREAGNPVTGCPPKVNIPRGIHSLR